MRPGSPSLLALLVAGCATRTASEAPSADASAARCALHDWAPHDFQLPAWADTTVLVLERTACFGECPRFEAHLFEDGRVEFRKPRYTRRMGPGSRALEPAQVERARALAGEIVALRSQRGGSSDAPELALHLQTQAGRVHYLHQPDSACDSRRRDELEAQLQRLLIGDWGDSDPQPWIEQMHEQSRREDEAERARRERLLELERGGQD